MAHLNTDIPELSGYDTGLCLSNLHVLGERMYRINESSLAILHELASAIVQDAGGDPDTVDSILLSLRSEAEERTDTPSAPEESPSADKTAEGGATAHARLLARVAPINRDAVARTGIHAGLYARLMLYRFIDELTRPAKPSVPSPAGSRLPESARGRIAYMPGAFADKAYERLSRLVPHPRVAAFHSFVEACEEVRGGLCEYGILPLENAQSGKLTAFSRLIIRYGLSIVAVCDLENGAAEGQTTRFALLRQAVDGDLSIPPTLSKVSSRPHDRMRERGSLEDDSHEPPFYLELLHTTADPSFTELLLAAEFCGLTLCRADTLPPFDELEGIGDGGDSPAICCVLSARAADLSTFHRFLTLEASEDIPMGLYYMVK